MIVVKVELWSAVTGQKTELARMEIANEGTHQNPLRGDYVARALIGRSTVQLDRRTTKTTTQIANWPRTQKHVWNLVSAALAKMGYGS